MLRRHQLLWVPLFLSVGCSDDDAGRPGAATGQPGTGSGAESGTDPLDSDSSGVGGVTGDPPLPTGGGAPCASGDACPPGAECVAPDGCASNFCVDGICCDTACEGACETCAPAGTCTPVSPETQPECAVGWVLGLGAPADVGEEAEDNFDRGTSMAVDDEGNVYLVGTYNQQVDFGGGVISTAGSDDPFVASFGPDGAYRWHNTFGGTGHDTGGGVAVIPGTNQVVVVGAVTGDPGLAGNWPKTGLRGFVAKFDRTTGAVGGSRALDATEFSRALSVAADAGGIYVTGGFRGTFEVGNPRVSLGDEDMFAVRLDVASLQPSWNWADGDTGKDLGRGIAVNAAGGVALTGYISASEDSQDIIVTSFPSPLGAAPAFRRLYTSPLSGAAKGHSVAWTAAGDLVMTGFFTGPVEFGQSTPDGGGRDAVLTSLNGTTGITNWAITFGGPGDDTSRSVAVDPLGNLFVAGDFSDSATIGAPLTSFGGKDVFVGMFMQDGTPAWTRGYGGVSNDNGNSVAPAPDGTLYAAGHFRESATFDATAMVAAEGADIFLMRLTQ